MYTKTPTWSLFYITYTSGIEKKQRNKGYHNISQHYMYYGQTDR